MKLRRFVFAIFLLVSAAQVWSQSRHDLMSADPEYLKLKARLEKNNQLSTTGQFKSLISQFTPNRRDQGQAGTCTMFAYLGLYEAAHFRSTGQRIDFAELWMVRSLLKNRQVREQIKASKNFIRGHGLSSYSLPIFHQMAKKFGFCREVHYPYDLGDELELLESDSPDYSNPRQQKVLARKQAERLAIVDAIEKGDQNHSLAHCQSEADIYRQPLAKYEVYTQRRLSFAFIQELINHDIPVAVMINVDNTNHEVIVSGHDRSGSLQLKNSWGIFGDMLGSELTFLGNHDYQFGTEVTGISEAEYLITPEDKARLCKQSVKLHHLKAICEAKKTVTPKKHNGRYKWIQYQIGRP